MVVSRIEPESKEKDWLLIVLRYVVDFSKKPIMISMNTSMGSRVASPPPTENFCAGLLPPPTGNMWLAASIQACARMNYAYYNDAK
jgi:hypothetical protein